MPDTEPEPLRWDMTLPNGQPLRWDTPGARWDGTVAEVMQALANQNQNPMNQNLINATLTAAQRDELIADIQALRAKQAAFLISNLTAEAKAELVKMGMGNMALEDLLRTAATENSGKLAGDFPLAAWDIDRAFKAMYSPVVAEMRKLAEDMENTLFATESDSWWAALEAYGDLKDDATGPAIDEARAIMRQRRRGRGGNGGNTPPPTT